MDPAFGSNDKAPRRPRQAGDLHAQQMQMQPSSPSPVDRGLTELAETSSPALLAVPQASSSNSSSSTATRPQSRHPKLDGVLYHFYSKTLAVITHCRLTHYEASAYTDTNEAETAPSTPVAGGPGGTPQSGTARQSSTVPTSATSRRVSKWFELEIADYDFFREEVRVWRNVSALIPSSVLDRPPSSRVSSDPSPVPPMILDIILDTSYLTERDLLVFDRMEMEGPREVRRRVRVDGKERGTDPNSRRSSIGKSKEEQSSELRDLHRKPIVLETWTLELGACNPLDPPDLPTLYRQATAHLKELLSLAKQLPLHGLYSRLQKGKALPSRGELEGGTSEGDLLKIGVRLCTEKLDEERDAEVCGLREPLGPSSQSSGPLTPKVTEVFNFQPLTTAVGILQCSVEYRVETDFYVEDLDLILNMRELDMEEDYFRPSPKVAQARREQARRATQDSPSLALHPEVREGLPSSLLSDRRQTILAMEHASLATGSPGTATPSPPAELSSRPTTSVFSSAASSGKPIAGLSSLRRTPSITTPYGSSPTTVMTGAAAINPLASAVGQSEAAFLTHGRRTSASERRLRTLSTLSNSGSGTGTDRASPPTASGGPSGSPSQQGSRPILARGPGSGLPSLRSGSYSPSSPSPLAQQMSMQQLSGTGAQSSPRMSSSPSYRAASLPLSASPSLRSIFHLYTPSQSQTSLSSLSRTPPRSLTEGTGMQAASSSLGLHGPGTTQGSPSQSSLVEGRRQPSVAPQMIKRYSTTFNYRQGRQAAAAAAQSGGSGLGEFSLDSEGSGNAPYSKSWQARIEQRQNFATRSLGREEGSGFSFASSQSPRMQRRSVGASTSQEDDLDNFVRMFDGESGITTNTTSRSGAAPVESAPRGGGGGGSGAVSFTSSPSGIGFHRHFGWNRTHVDEMLTKMQSSVRDFGTSSTSKGSAGGATTSSSGGSGQSGGAGAGSEGPSSLGYGPTSFQAASPGFVRSPLSKGGFSATSSRPALVPAPSTTTTTASLSSASATRPPLPFEKRAVIQYGVSGRRDLHSRASGSQAEDSLSTSAQQGEAARLQGGDEQADDALEKSPGRHVRQSTSRGSLNVYGGQPHSYDPLDDEAVGRLELVHDEMETRDSGAESEDQAIASVHRRRADLELARNFGQSVSSSSHRGNQRNSLSPWRTRLHGMSAGGNNRNGNLPAAMSGGAGNGSGNGNGGGSGNGNGNGNGHGSGNGHSIGSGAT